MIAPAFFLCGVGASKGYAFGNAVLIGKNSREVPHYYITAAQCPHEITRLESAIAVVTSDLKSQTTDFSEEIPEEIVAILNAHILIAEDPDLLSACSKNIVDKLYNAEWALSNYMQQVSEVFSAMEDEYLRERIEDVQQVINRITDALTGNSVSLDYSRPEQTDIHKDLIIVSHDISPADMITLRDGKFVGFCTDLGTPTSHTAIVARSIGVPAAVAMRNASLCIKDGDFLILDGFEGNIIVNPSKQILDHYLQAAEQHQLLLQSRRSLLEKVIVSKQDKAISLLANIDGPSEAKLAVEYKANGVGLFRTEFLFLNRSTPPSEEEQYIIYKDLLQQFGSNVVTIRTLDLGADKILSGTTQTSPNPALGLRAIRFCLAKQGFFTNQLRALLRASVFGNLKILIPMIMNLDEVRVVKEILEKLTLDLQKELPEFTPSYAFGIMVEVPACALTIEQFLPHVDFISIGTNDLIQYTLAIDRQDQEVAYLYDPHHPAILYLLKHCIESAHRHGKSVCVCGEVASDPKYIDTLLSLGLTEFSVPPHSLLEVKEALLNSEYTT